jgi:nucleoside 2-deoxyribosyltransferase
MKFYIASSLKNWEQVNELNEILEQKGWINTCNWANYGLVKNSSSTSKELGKISINQMQAIIESDVIICILPMGRGAHVELGASVALYMMGLPKKVYLYSEDPKLFESNDKTAGIYHNPVVIQKSGSLYTLVNDIISDSIKVK